MKKILIFSLAYYPLVGGAEVAIKELTDRLGNDFEFDMVTLRTSPSSLRQEKIGNVNVYRIGFGTTHYLNKVWYIIGAFLKARRLFKKRKYDMSWAMMSYMGFPALFLKWSAKLPFVVTLQEGDSVTHITGRPHIRLVLKLYRKIFKEAAVIQVISNYLGDFAKSMNSGVNIEVIPNGVDLNKFTFKPKMITDSAILITTSRLVEKNAVGDIIDALNYMPENVLLWIAGIGPLESALKSKVQERRLTERVRFLGFIHNEDLPKYLHAADIFIRPSLTEGMGISFIEAMAAGLPVIATPVGGIVDFIKDGETGLFCEVNNPKSIAQKVEKLIKDRESRDYIVHNARVLVTEKYDWSSIAHNTKHRVFGVV